MAYYNDFLLLTWNISQNIDLLEYNFPGRFYSGDGGINFSFLKVNLMSAT